jgi:magnesium chelatase family protein
VKELEQQYRTARSFFHFKKPQSIWRPPMFAKKAPALICQFALGILGANGDLAEEENLIHILCVGELSLDGRVRAIKGALPIAILAREGMIRNVILPEENAKEAAVVSGVNVYPVADLRQCS